MSLSFDKVEDGLMTVRVVAVNSVVKRLFNFLRKLINVLFKMFGC